MGLGLRGMRLEGRCVATLCLMLYLLGYLILAGGLTLLEAQG